VVFGVGESAEAEAKKGFREQRHCGSVEGGRRDGIPGEGAEPPRRGMGDGAWNARDNKKRRQSQWEHSRVVGVQ
jgi:hypothetical protein